MIQDDRIGIGYGPLCLTEDPAFMSFDGAKFILDEEALKEHLSNIANAGANFIRVLPWGVWMHHLYGKAGQFQPYLLETSRDRWDLGSFNTYYFAIFRHILEIANGIGLTVMFCWFDNCQFGGTVKKWSPWASNVQALDSFYGANADHYTTTWINAVIDSFKDLDVIFAFGNEMEDPAFPAMIKRVIFPIIREKQLDFNFLTYGATMTSVPYLGNNKYAEAAQTIQDQIQGLVGEEFGDEAKLNMFKEIHGCGGPAAGTERPFGAHVDQALYWWGRHPIRKIFSDDGVLDGDSLCDRESTGRARPSAVTWGKIASQILINYPFILGGLDHLLNFEHVPYGGDLACQVEMIGAISKSYCGRFGVWPTNCGKHSHGSEVRPAPASSLAKSRGRVRHLRRCFWRKKS